jgi:Holliday junction resolvase-like predicted endonuclease
MKPFDQSLYDADDNAKDLVIRWLNSYGYSMEVNPDQYGIDLIGFNNEGKPITVEVEVKHHWTGPAFPFPTVHVSARKRKFIQPDAYLVMVNHDRTHCLTLDYAALSWARLVTKPTVYTVDEQFLEVTIDKAKIRELPHG